jgi:hypothetical protein
MMAATAFSVHVGTGLWTLRWIFTEARWLAYYVVQKLQFQGLLEAVSLVVDEWVQHRSGAILMVLRSDKLSQYCADTVELH